MSDFKIKYSDWEEYNLVSDASIDRYALDEEIVKHQIIMTKWLELLTQAQAEYTKTKEGVENVEAKLFIKAKNGEVPSLGSKPTDSTVKAWVRIQPSYKRALRKRRIAFENMQYLQNVKVILEHRKAMLKTEADLWITGYFSKPNISAIESKTKKEHSDKLKKSLRKRHLRQ